MKKDDYIKKYGTEAYNRTLVYSKDYYKKNREGCLEKNKVYRQKNKEKISERKKEYRIEHHDEMITKERKYSEEHREKIQNRYSENKKDIQEYQKKYYKSNQIIFREKSKNYYQKNKKMIQLRRKEKKYWKTPKGILCAKKHDTKRRRQLGFDLIAKFGIYKILSPTDFHHIDNENVIEIPRWLHKKCGDSKTNSHREKVKIAIQDHLNSDYYDIFNSKIFDELIIDKGKEEN